MADIEFVDRFLNTAVIIVFSILPSIDSKKFKYILPRIHIPAARIPLTDVIIRWREDGRLWRGVAYALKI